MRMRACGGPPYTIRLGPTFYQL
uniref:Uncharacterized protein n=1 Tax=Rhizophora mucronata TaxID=61149 RepID=A0A2P2NVS3_RHIMU